MKRTPVLLISLILSIAGLSIFAYKALSLNFPLSPNATANVWRVEASVAFNTQGRPAKVSTFIPKSSSYFSVLDESFISRGFGLSTLSRDGNRVAEWAIRRISGRQTLYYQAVVRQIEVGDASVSSKAPEVIPPEFEEAELEAAKTILADSKAQSIDTQSQIRAILQRISMAPPDDSVSLLIGTRSTELERLTLATKILALDRIPARIVHGVQLTENRRGIPLTRWLEVHSRSLWLSFDKEGNDLRDPETLLPWWRGTESIGTVAGGSRLDIKVSVSRQEESAIMAAIDSGKTSKPFLLEFSLFSLPLQTQGVFRTMLLVPLGGLLIVLLRNVVGLPTFGTFMPVLVALAFRETDLLMGCVFFSLVVALGLIIRFGLERMKLLLVPRLAAVLTIVVLLLSALAIASHKFGVGHSISLGLFPMVILTMTIERMSITWDELGAGTALKQGAGSLFAAILATFILMNEFIEHLFFVFPELLLVVTALCLLLGRYTGYRLTELRRFRAFGDVR